MIAKGLSQRFAIIVISGDQKIWNFQATEDRSQSPIFVRRTSLGEIARGQDDRRTGIHGVEAIDRPVEIIGGISHVVQHVAASADVEIRNLRYDHANSVAAARYFAIKSRL
jgi:hypothetical protein